MDHEPHIPYRVTSKEEELRQASRKHSWEIGSDMLPITECLSLGVALPSKVVARGYHDIYKVISLAHILESTHYRARSTTFITFCYLNVSLFVNVQLQLVSVVELCISNTGIPSYSSSSVQYQPQSALEHQTPFPADCNGVYLDFVHVLSHREFVTTCLVTSSS